MQAPEQGLPELREWLWHHDFTEVHVFFILYLQSCQLLKRGDEKAIIQKSIQHSFPVLPCNALELCQDAFYRWRQFIPCLNGLR